MRPFEKRMKTLTERARVEPEDASAANWPVLMYAVMPFYPAAGAVDVADRLWRRSSRGRNRS